MDLTYLIAPDSFKGSLASRKAAETIARAVMTADPRARVDLLPLSDGGEGLLDALQPVIGGEEQCSTVTGAAGGEVQASWLLFHEGREALLESAQCLGLTRIPAARRNPRRTSSRGLGELLLHVASRGVARVWLGLGGSSTNDAGYGLGLGLGFVFKPQPAASSDIVDAMLEVRSITPSKSMHEGTFPEVICLTDVDAPLLGPQGATRTFARQKGASVDDVDALETAVEAFASLVGRDIADVDTQAPGMGAAGGLGFGCAAFCNGELRSGIATVLDMLSFDRHCAEADVVITGEGRVDSQTRMGKTVGGVAERAGRMGKPVLVFAGAIEGDAARFERELGIAALLRVAPEGMPEQQCLDHAEALLHDAVVRHVRARKSL